MSGSAKKTGRGRPDAPSYTFTAPMSFSVLWAFSDAAGKTKLEAMFEAAVARSVGQLNGYTNKTRGE